MISKPPSNLPPWGMLCKISLLKLFDAVRILLYCVSTYMMIYDAPGVCAGRSGVIREHVPACCRVDAKAGMPQVHILAHMKTVQAAPGQREHATAAFRKVYHYGYESGQPE